MGNLSTIRNRRWRLGISWIRTAVALFFSSVLLVAGLASKHNAQKSSDGIPAAPAFSIDLSGGTSTRTLGDDFRIAERPLFPYSVIPGGVQSPQELQNAILRDPAVAAHYTDFDLAKAHIIFLDRDRTAYVSYRMGGEIFWTNRPLRLRKGETVITDGAHEARTRCGNRISESPQSPTLSGRQPELEAFEQQTAIVGQLAPLNLPVNGPLTGPSLFLLPVPAATDHNDFFPNFIPFVPGAGPAAGTTLANASAVPSGTGSAFGPGAQIPPIGTPEPSTFLLLATGLSGLGIAYKHRKAE